MKFYQKMTMNILIIYGNINDPTMIESFLYKFPDVCCRYQGFFVRLQKK